MGGSIKECWRLIGACLVCGSNENKVRDYPRARSFTAPWTGRTVSVVQKSNKDNKSVASLSAPRQATRTMGRQDTRALIRAYVMKAVEEKDAPDVIVDNFYIFETIVHELIDLGSAHSYICTAIPSLGSLPKSETEYDILVTNPLGHSVIVNRVHKDCPIKILKYEFPGDLIKLSFREFDVILGMDWLSRHQVVSRSDPNGGSEPVTGCSFNSLDLHFIKFSFSKNVATRIPGSTGMANPNRSSVYSDCFHLSYQNILFMLFHFRVFNYTEAYPMVGP